MRPIAEFLTFFLFVAPGRRATSFTGNIKYKLHPDSLMLGFCILCFFFFHGLKHFDIKAISAGLD